MRIFLDRTVPLGKRDVVREVVAMALAPTLGGHPNFSSLAVLVSSDPRRGGWQVSVLVLDPALDGPTPELAVDVVALNGLHEALARI